MDTTTNQVISRSLVCVWVTGIAFPPNWTTLPHGQHMYTWSPASWKSGQPSTTRLCHTLDNHPDNHPLAGQKHTKLPALTSVGILGNDYYWIDGKRSIDTRHPLMPWFNVMVMLSFVKSQLAITAPCDATICWGNGFTLVRRQAIIWNNEPNFKYVLSRAFYSVILTLSYAKIRL